MSKTRICLLPKEGIENPYQVLMKRGLESGGYDVKYGSKVRFIDIIHTYFTKKPDWIHFDWPYIFYSVNLPSPFKWLLYYWFKLQLSFISRFTDCKFSQTLHNIHRHEVYHPKIDHKAQQLLFKHCKFIRVFHEGTIDKVKQKWPNAALDKFKVQPEGSYVGYYPNSIDRDTARKELGYTPEDFVILYLGSIRPYKGVDELLEAFLETRKPHWKLIIAGYPYDKEYTEMIKERSSVLDDVTMYIGHQPEEKLQYYFNASNVVASPFREIENSGSVILAMGFKRAILAPRKGVLIKRLVEQYELLYEDNIKEALTSLHQMDRQVLNDIGQRNYEELEKHTWQDFSKLFY
jgi:beta-1,4-mannosyltransferase